MKIHRLVASSLDKKRALAKIPSPNASLAAVDFEKVVVNKPWGYEYLIYSNPFVHVWSLFIKSGEATSMHCHPGKKTALLLLSGEAGVSFLGGHIDLAPIEGAVIEKGVFHSTRALSEKGAGVLEVETPPIKHDLLRLKDNYGRERSGYEGLEQMTSNPKGAIRFSNVSVNEYHRKKICSHFVSVKRISGGYNGEDIKHIKGYDLAIVLGGVIYKKNKIFCSAADIVAVSDFIDEIESHRIGDLTLMLIKKSQR